MLKLLFHRSGLTVRLLEVIGVLNSILFLKRQLPSFDVTAGLYCLLFTLYLFVRICDWIPWYRGKPRGMGIEVHFRKALVPTSYILAIVSSLSLLEISLLTTPLVVFAILLMLVVAPVNGIQIYFHLRDRDSLPINYFSSNQHLHEKVPIPSH